ncbi:CRISPR-associated exonuclease, Cas4 family [Longilinea arvoryzae]|uniref:CRISPR-associated exonuclease, Cas4 family n=1 Tax=Longilinea arvoryzae TaxID=360412 RepID=A0A0S7BE65_9CHLR|nr:Dna2/Cas4 domain-containing protein [Longilinea arvoryzae]GAP12312.1 CRISPR-associated exonuclease, Cas4 family [Longilinea arvoryzae]
MGLWIAALAAALLAALLLWWGNRQQLSAGLPRGRVIYADPKMWGRPEKAFFDVQTGLTGKPDYLVEQGGDLLPVEVKSAWAPPAPYASHLFQLIAYCLLVERATGKRPPYGILRYRDRTFAIDYTHEWEERLLEELDVMRALEKRGEADRSHDEAGRCRKCGYRSVCDQKL